jgi:hypothetical protein
LRSLHELPELEEMGSLLEQEAPVSNPEESVPVEAAAPEQSSTDPE